MYTSEHLELKELENDFFGKKARARREERREKRKDRRIEKIDARGDNRVALAKAGGGLKNFATGLLGSLTGGGAEPTEDSRAVSIDIQSQEDQAAALEAAAAKRRMTTIVVIVLVLVLVAVFYLRNKK